MTDVENVSDGEEARKKVLQEQMDFASSRISETVRYVSLGQIGVAYTIIISTTPFAVSLMNSFPNFLYWVVGFGCAALTLDAIQYILMYERAVHSINHLKRDFTAGWVHYLLGFSFRVKGFVALFGIGLLAYVLFNATYFASKDPAMHSYSPSAQEGTILARPATSVTARRCPDRG